MTFLNHFLPMIISALLITLYFVALYYLQKWEDHDHQD